MWPFRLLTQPKWNQKKKSERASSILFFLLNWLEANSSIFMIVLWKCMIVLLENKIASSRVAGNVIWKSKSMMSTTQIGNVLTETWVSKYSKWMTLGSLARVRSQEGESGALATVMGVAIACAVTSKQNWKLNNCKDFISGSLPKIFRIWNTQYHWRFE